MPRLEERIRIAKMAANYSVVACTLSLLFSMVVVIVNYRDYGPRPALEYPLPNCLLLLFSMALVHISSSGLIISVMVIYSSKREMERNL